MTFRRISCILSLTLLVGLEFSTAAEAQTSCPSIPPMPMLELKSTYSDSKFSIINNDNEVYNKKTMEPIYTLFNTVEKAIDNSNARPGYPQSDCAFQNFHRWAEAGALTFEPAVYEGQGKVTRGLLNPGFQMIAIKFRAAGYMLDDTIVAWLRKMDQANIAFYSKGNLEGNQSAWAGAGAALNSLIQKDPIAIDFQDKVWHVALHSINDNSYIDTELKRGQQALVYHMYFFSAALTLEAARSALGYPESAQERTRMASLADGIGRTLCDPSDMARFADAKMRIPDGEWAYEIANGFGGSYINADWTRCGLPPTDFNARDMGGDTRRSAAILKSITH